MHVNWLQGLFLCLHNPAIPWVKGEMPEVNFIAGKYSLRFKLQFVINICYSLTQCQFLTPSVYICLLPSFGGGGGGGGKNWQCHQTFTWYKIGWCKLLTSCQKIQTCSYSKSNFLNYKRALDTALHKKTMYQRTKPMCTPIKQCCIYTPISLST